MNLQETLARLEALGSERMREQNRRRGAASEQYGVRMGDIRALAKEIKPNPTLAAELWQTGNIDARLLAVLLFKPADLSIEAMDRMAREADFSQLADWFNAYLAGNHPQKEALRGKWLADSHPWAARAGWALTSGRISKDPAGLDLAALLDRLEAEMAAAPPPTQWTMNFCLAGIGIHAPELRQRALEIGERLGLYRDYPTPKGCTSPFAPIWINEMVRRQG